MDRLLDPVTTDVEKQCESTQVGDETDNSNPLNNRLKVNKTSGKRKSNVVPRTRLLRKVCLQNKDQIANKKPKGINKRKLAQSVPRSTKRVRQQSQPFQLANSASSSNKNKEKDQDKIVIYNFGDFLAVRNESNSFFLCRAKQTIYRNGRKIKIQWYNNDKDAKVYCPDFYDFIDFECILTNMRVTRLEKGGVSIPENEKQRARNILERAINVEKGINEPPDPHKVLSDGLDISIIGKIEEQDILDKIKCKSNKKGRGPGRKSLISNGNLKNGKSPHEKLVMKKEISEQEQYLNSTQTSLDQNNDIDESIDIFKIEKKLDNDVVQMEIDYETEVKDLMFDTKKELPLISTYVNSKLLIRAVLLKDFELLRLFVQDSTNICSITVPRSAFINRNSIHYALENEDVAMLDLLLKIESSNHGKYPHHINSMELYHSELMLDCNSYNYQSSKLKHLDKKYAKFLVKNCISLDFLVKIQSFFENGLQSFTDNLLLTIRSGNYDLAFFLVQEICKTNNEILNKSHLKFFGSEMNEELDLDLLHLCTNQDWKLYPIHIAAANPDPYFFFYIISNSSNQLYKTDVHGWMPIHYAAICKTFFNLQYLLNIGVSTTLVNEDGNTPLHLATRCNSLENVALIIKSEMTHSSIAPSLRSYNKKGWTPIHIACKKGFVKIITLFIENKVDIDIVTSNNSGELTPLMIACKYGHLEIVKLLIDNRANINLFDKKNRGPLTYAVINGHSSIMSYLLKFGANPSFKDIFGNNLFHYALAYGWYFCYEILLKTNVNLKDTNTFGLTPICVAFMKGHIGIIQNILKRNILSVNVPVNDMGITLVMYTFSLFPNETLITYLKLFLEKFKCDLLKTDYDGNNALHYLLRCEAKYKNENSPKVNETIKQALDLLLVNGCDPFLMNQSGISPIMFSLQNECFISFTRFFQEHYKSIRFQQILSESEHVIPLFISHLLTPITVDGIQVSTGKYICNIFDQCKNIQNLLKKLCLKPNKNGDIPIEFYIKTTNKILAIENSDLYHDEIIEFLDFLLKFYDAKFLEDIFLLHLAAKYGNASIVRRLIKIFSYIDTLNESNLTPLAVAIQNHNKETAQVLIESGANINFKIGVDSCFVYELKNNSSFSLIPIFINFDVNINETDANMNTALHLICQNANGSAAIESINILIKKGIDVNCLNQLGQTALHKVFQSNRITPQLCSIFDILLQNGIDIVLKDHNGYNALHYMFMSNNENSDLIEVLKMINFKNIDHKLLLDKSNQSFLHYSSEIGAAECVSYLLSCNFNNSADSYMRTPLALSIQGNHKDCAYILLKSDSTFFENFEYFDNKTNSKINLLSVIVKNDWKDILSEMIEKAKTLKRMETLIEILIQSQCISYAISSLDFLQDSSSLDSDYYKKIIRIFGKYSTSQIDKELQRKFLDQFNSEILTSEAQNLFLIGLSNWNYILCNELIDIFGIQKILTFFQESQINPLSSVFKNLNPSQQLPDEIKKLILLLLQDIDINTLAQYPIVEKTNSICRYCLVEEIDSNCSVLYSPLIVSIINQHYSIVQWLLSLNVDGESSVDLNFSDSKKRTPLMHAILNNDIKMVRLLLDRNYSFDTIDNCWESYPTKNANSIDLATRDVDNRTVFHHLICPFVQYNYAKGHVIFDLLWSLLDSNIKTLDFERELYQFSSQNNAFNILNLLEKSGAQSFEKKIIDKSIKSKVSIYNFKNDYENLIKQNINNKDHFNKKSNNFFGFSNGQIIKDESTNTPYDVTFTKLDNQKSNYIYNFYKIQLFMVGDKSALFIRWGQVGTIGNLHKIFYDSKDEAIEDFKKIFLGKSGNKWMNIEEITPGENKYKLMDTKRHKKHIWLDLDVKFEKFIHSKSDLPLCLRDFLFKKIKSSVENLKKFDKYENFNYNLNSSLLNSCIDILMKIYESILKQDTYRKVNKKENVKYTVDIIDYSEEFYSQIQIYGNQFDQLKPILTLVEFYEKCKYVYTLKHAMFCKELLFCAQNTPDTNPIDYIYDSFVYGFENIINTSGEYHFVQLYLTNSINGVDIEGLTIFSVNAGCNSTVSSNNSYLLWYNIEDHEFFSIFLNGFQKGPIKTEINARFVTNGIKFTNQVIKKNNDEYNYLLLCEVPLERILEIDFNEVIDYSMLDDKDCLIVGKDKSDQSYLQKYLSWNGFTVPLQNSDLNGPQDFIYFDANKIIPRYLVEYKLI